MVTPDDAAFPRGLLQHAPQERLAYFKEYTIAHTRMEQVFGAVEQAIREPANAAYILVVGPTGVGKTTLRWGLERHLGAILSAELARDPGRLPVCSTTAVSPDSGSFNWKDYYRRALQALHEPLINDKVATGRTETRPDPGVRMPPSAADAPALRRALEHALTYRRPAAFIVDEAQHLLKMASGRRLQDQMDCLKSLADHGQTVHVLLGTYDLLVLQTLNGQVIRRGITLHFPRYRADSPTDIRAFQRVLVSFEHHLPVRERPDLLSLWPYCFERSVGCVGILKDWLTRALATALTEEAATVTQAHLIRHALSAVACERIVSEALYGEEQLLERAEVAAHLRMRLGLDDRGTAQGACAEAPRRRPDRPGERRPTRDTVRREQSHAG
ncbi:MAG: ATP-binding protein [Chloroflexota bacterium]